MRPSVMQAGEWRAGAAALQDVVRDAQPRARRREAGAPERAVGVVQPRRPHRRLARQAARLLALGARAHRVAAAAIARVAHHVHLALARPLRATCSTQSALGCGAELCEVANRCARKNPQIYGFLISPAENNI